MFNISKEFAPPFRLIAPFFITGVAFYLLASAALLFYPATFHYGELSVAGWVHLFLVGYVMMVIFGAMAQLVPVVVESGHFSVDWYYLIFPLLLGGTVTLILGFWFNPILLGFGGLLVLSAMVIFAVEVLLTIRRSHLDSLTVKAVKVSNIFLLIGIVTGFLMALTLSGLLGIDVEAMVRVHLFAVLGGYIMITIFGISMVLLPMFGLAHGFDEGPVKGAFRLMVVAVTIALLSPLGGNFLFLVAFQLSLLAVALYLYQIALIYRTRVRRETEVWYLSMVAGYSFLALALLLGFLVLLSGGELNLVYAMVWALFAFFAFLINGHLYKIVPFLVWFHRFSPLVGKRKVPMLHEMYPKRGAAMEFWFSLIGSLLVELGLLIESTTALRAGASFLLVGAIFLATSLKFMLMFKES
ncbi:MAG: hypothetical protein GXO19_00850 [Epsilonproteobacteria bacterium]|nr:hypothetical protein [Campylobacterota bacterium]NPA56261.1 hypothetical protein [Campylobacterota bacterium]